MAEYASKGVAGTALGLGIAGTVGLVSQMANGCGGGILGGLGGGNCNAQGQYVSELQAKVQGLEAQRYSDQVAKEVYMQALADNHRLDDQMEAKLATITANLNALNDYAHNQAIAQARTEEQIKCCCKTNELEHQNLLGKMETLAATANGRFTGIDREIACLAGKVNSITETVVNGTKVCPQYMPLYNSWTAPTAAAPTSVQLTNPVVTVQG